MRAFDAPREQIIATPTVTDFTLADEAPNVPRFNDAGPGTSCGGCDAPKGDPATRLPNGVDPAHATQCSGCTPDKPCDDCSSSRIASTRQRLGWASLVASSQHGASRFWRLAQLGETFFGPRGGGRTPSLDSTLAAQVWALQSLAVALSFQDQYAVRLGSGRYARAGASPCPVPGDVEPSDRDGTLLEPKRPGWWDDDFPLPWDCARFWPQDVVDSFAPPGKLPPVVEPPPAPPPPACCCPVAVVFGPGNRGNSYLLPPNGATITADGANPGHIPAGNVGDWFVVDIYCYWIPWVKFAPCELDYEETSNRDTDHHAAGKWNNVLKSAKQRNDQRTLRGPTVGPWVSRMENPRPGPLPTRIGLADAPSIAKDNFLNRNNARAWELYVKVTAGCPMCASLEVEAHAAQDVLIDTDGNVDHIWFTHWPGPVSVSNDGFHLEVDSNNIAERDSNSAQYPDRKTEYDAWAGERKNRWMGSHGR